MTLYFQLSFPKFASNFVLLKYIGAWFFQLMSRVGVEE